MSEPHKSFFQTFTGAITAITSLIIAITGLYAATDGFNFGDKSEVKTTTETSTQDHQQTLEALKRQKEIDDLRIAQEKQKLLAEKELAALRAENARLDRQRNEPDETVSPPSSQNINTTLNKDLSGHWLYTNAAGNYTFVFTQNGNEIMLQEYDSYGNNVGNGGGLIEGSEVFLNWVEPYLFVMSLEVQAELVLNPAGTTLMGNMYTEESTVPVIFYRQ